MVAGTAATEYVQFDLLEVLRKRGATEAVPSLWFLSASRNRPVVNSTPASVAAPNNPAAAIALRFP